jgi:hypothetical protein
MDSRFNDDAAECNDFKQFMLSQDLMYMQEMDDEDDELTIVASAALVIYADEGA